MSRLKMTPYTFLLFELFFFFSFTCDFVSIQQFEFSLILYSSAEQIMNMCQVHE